MMRCLPLNRAGERVRSERDPLGGEAFANAGIAENLHFDSPLVGVAERSIDV